MQTPHADPQPVDALERAFLAAEYHVLAPSGALIVRPGQSCPVLDRLAGGRRWCILTAFNPGGRRCSAVANRRRAARLNAALDDAAPALRLPACNRDPAGRWPDEPGWLLSFDTPDPVHELARRFGQVGVVCGGRGGPAQLWRYAPDGSVRSVVA